jgi:hypothetical protein
MVNTSLLFRMLGRALRTSESRVLLASLTIAVAALASVSFFADRVSRAIELQAGELIGGDLSYSSDKPLEADVLAAIRAKANVRSATTTTFPSMSSFAKDGDVQAQLVDIKAVTDGFPLRGQLMLADQLADIEAGKVSPRQRRPTLARYGSRRKWQASSASISVTRCGLGKRNLRSPRGSLKSLTRCSTISASRPASSFVRATLPRRSCYKLAVAWATKY